MTTFDRLKDVFTAVFEDDETVDISNLTENSELIGDLGMNSIGMLYMAMAIEEEFSIKFKNEDFKNLKTVADVIAIIDNK